MKQSHNQRLSQIPTLAAQCGLRLCLVGILSIGSGCFSSSPTPDDCVKALIKELSEGLSNASNLVE